MHLTREQILAKDDRRRVTVTVDEWGGDITLREMSVAQKDEMERRLMDAQRDGDLYEAARGLRSWTLAVSIVDAAGAPLFTVDDIAALSEKSALVVARLHAEVLKLNGMTVVDAEDTAKK